MAPISISPITSDETSALPQNTEETSPSESTGFSPEIQVVHQEDIQAAPTLTPIDGGYAGLPKRTPEIPVALEQMGPSNLSKTNVPMMIQGGVFVLLPLFFANNPAMFQQNRMFIWILFALGCGLIASQVPGVDNLNLPKIKLFGLEFAARGWVAVSIIVVMALVNPTKPILDVVSSAINNNKPVVSTSVTVSPDSKTGNLKETVPEASTPSHPAPLTIASVPDSSEAPASITADTARSKPDAINSFTALTSTFAAKTAAKPSLTTSDAKENASTIGVSSAGATTGNDVTTLEKISYRDRIVLPTVQWQAMGIVLKTGDLLSINNVRGTWTLSDPAHDNYPYVDADGGAQALASPKVKANTTQSFIMPSAPPAALIGKIGLHGRPFIVGKHLGSLPVNDPGELYLSINDGSTLGTPGFWDNAGQIQANINVLTAANLD